MGAWGGDRVSVYLAFETLSNTHFEILTMGTKINLAGNRNYIFGNFKHTVSHLQDYSKEMPKWFNTKYMQVCLLISDTFFSVKTFRSYWSINATQKLKSFNELMS